MFTAAKAAVQNGGGLHGAGSPLATQLHPSRHKAAAQVYSRTSRTPGKMEFYFLDCRLRGDEREGGFRKNPQGLIRVKWQFDTGDRREKA
jgi:hypothetical protein